MHGTVTIERLNGALIFNSADDMLAAMFGASQHDRHVLSYHQHLRLKHGYYQTFKLDGRALEALEAKSRAA